MTHQNKYAQRTALIALVVSVCVGVVVLGRSHMPESSVSLASVANEPSATEGGGLGPAPAQPMSARPVTPVEAAVLQKGVGGDLVASVSDKGEVCLSLNRDGRGGGLCADPTLVERIILGEGGDSADDPQMYLFGVSQGQIDEFRFVAVDGKQQIVKALHHPAISGLSFFVAPAMGPLRSLEAVGDGFSIAASEQALRFTNS